MMNYLPLPFWALTRRHEPQHALAFSEAGRWTQFLQTQNGGDWTQRAVITETDLIVLVAELHQHGIRTLCLNPESDGGGGTRVELQDVLKRLTERA